MKYLYAIAFLLMLTAASNKSPGEGCFPDKGIKTAKIIAKLENASKDSKEIHRQEIQYDKRGRPLVKINGRGEGTTRYEYRDEKLVYTLTESKLTDFYFGEQESPDENTKTRIDTAVVLRHSEDGRPIEMTGLDGTTLLINYTGCEVALQTMLKENGDTIQQYQLIYKEGVLVETIWTPFMPIKSARTSQYFGYKFNKRGHWIKRSYTHQGKGVITENRKLTYY